jgi:hypothetical protein
VQAPHDGGLVPALYGGPAQAPFGQSGGSPLSADVREGDVCSLLECLRLAPADGQLQDHGSVLGHGYGGRAPDLHSGLNLYLYRWLVAAVYGQAPTLYGTPTPAMYSGPAPPLLSGPAPALNGTPAPAPSGGRTVALGQGRDARGGLPVDPESLA